MRGVLGSILAVTVALGLGACRDAATPTVASAQAPPSGAGPASPVPSASAKETDYDKALRYTRCMNDHGQKISDPVEGEPLAVSAATGGWQFAGTAAFTQCKQYLPDTWPVKVDPQALSKEQAFDDCMRKRGIDIPVPDANGMVYYDPNPDGQETPEYQAAIDACRYLYDDPANHADQ
jgi:hypothetical protein